MSCSYGAGVAGALVNEFNITEPDIIIAGSGSAGTFAYYTSKQYDLVTGIWENLLSTDKFINPFRFWRILDIDYLIDNFFKKQTPLDLETIYDSKTEFFIPATNLKTGKIEYFSNKNHDGIFEALRATKAMPLLYGKRVKINSSYYCDTPLTSDVESHLQRAIEQGATDIIVIDMSNSNKFRGLGFDAWLSLRNKNFKRKYNEQKEVTKNQTLPQNVNVINIKPSKELFAKNLNNDRQLLRKNINLGYNDCKNNLDIKNLSKS